MIDPKLCPFCKKSNNCQVENPNTCWCKNTKIPEEIKNYVPEEYIMKACICKDCVELFVKDKETFLKLYN